MPRSDLVHYTEQTRTAALSSGLSKSIRPIAEVGVAPPVLVVEQELVDRLEVLIANEFRYATVVGT